MEHGQHSGPDRLIAGRFRVTGLLKEWRSVRTLAAVDDRSGERVVIKESEASGISTGDRQRLEHEAQVLRELQTPWLAPLLGCGMDGESFYLVEPFVEGITLAERLRRGRLTLAEALTVARCLLAALEEVHSHDILHRDVKPSNVIVDDATPLRRAVLIDFGLARSERLEGSLRDLPAGTARYVSPEQAGLLDRALTAAADLYSVGVVLFECLAGQPPFEGEGVGEILRQHLSAPPPELRSLGIAVPEAVDKLVQHLIRKDPLDRYQTAGAALSDVLAIEAALTRGEGEPEVTPGANDRRSVLTEPSFVGRRPELEVLAAQLEAAASGAGGLVLLEAESGGGKSWLLRELRRAGERRGARIYTGQALDQTAQRPFQLLDDIATALVESASRRPELGRTLSARIGEEADAVRQALPRLGAILDGEQAPEAAGTLGPEALGPVRSVRALSRLLDALGDSAEPVLVLLDDCQWAEELSVELLVKWSASRAAHRHVLVVASFRSEEVPAGHPLRATRPIAHVRLAPFAREGVRDLAESMAGPLPAEAVEAVVRLSEGNPFMASAVLQGLAESGALRSEAHGWVVDAARLTEAQSSRKAAVFLSRRLRTFPQGVLRLLSAAAICGKDFDDAVAGALAEMSPEESAATLAEARRRHVVWVLGEGRHGFVHDKLRETLLDLLGAERRRELHRAAADSLEAQHPGRCFDLAYHFDAAGEPGRALPYALDAARQARTQHSLAVAERYYRIAKAAPSAPPSVRQEVAEQLGEVLMLRGQYGPAAEELATAFALADQTEARARIQGLLGELAFKRGDVRAASVAIEAGLELLGRAIPRRSLTVLAWLLYEVLVQVLHSLLPRRLVVRHAAPPSGATQLALRLYSRLAYAYWFGRGKIPCAWAHLREMNLAERYPDSEELAQAWSEHAPVMTMIPAFARGIRYAERSLAIRRGRGDLWGQGQSLHFYGVVLYGASRFADCIDKCTEAVRLMERTGDRWEVNTARWHIAFCRYRLGDLGGAVALARQVYRDGLALGDVQACAISLGVWAKASAGRVPAELLEAASSRPSDDEHALAELAQADAARLLREGQPDEAARRLETARRRIEGAGLRQEYVAPVYPWLATALRTRIEALSPYEVAGRRVLLRWAGGAIRRAVRVARSYRNNLPHALREAGLLAALRGAPESARAHLDESAAIAREQGQRHELVLTLAARARLGRAEGWRDASDDERAAEELRLELEGPAGVGEPARSVTLSLVDRFDTILEAGRRIASSLTRPALFSSIRKAAAELLRGERCWILIVDGEGPEFRFSAVGEAEPAGWSKTLVRRAIARGRPVTLGEGPHDEPTESIVFSEVRSALCAPVFAHGRAAACIYLTHGHVGGLFGEDEERLAEFIATIAGAAIEVQEAVTLRDDFLAIAGHELRTPLAALKLQIQGLQRFAQNGQPLPEPALLFERLAKTAAHERRLERLIDELLDVTRIASGRLTLTREAIDLGRVATDVAERFADQLAGARCELRLATTDAPVSGRWDASRIDQVITNLLGNAVKYGAGKPIEVRVARQGDFARLSIRDEGIGIDPDAQKRLFGRFERAVSSRHYGGLGLGLWITRQIVEAHGGAIGFESVLGAGSTFTVDLPVEPG